MLPLEKGKIVVTFHCIPPIWPYAHSSLQLHHTWMKKEAWAEFRNLLKIFEKKCKKPYRNDFHSFLVTVRLRILLWRSLYGSEYYCEDFIRSSLFWILLKTCASGGRLPIGQEVEGAFISWHKVIYDLNFKATCSLMQWDDENKHSRER